MANAMFAYRLSMTPVFSPFYPCAQLAGTGLLLPYCFCCCACCLCVYAHLASTGLIFTQLVDSSDGHWWIEALVNGWLKLWSLVLVQWMIDWFTGSLETGG